MYRRLCIVLLISIAVLVGCKDSLGYDDEEVAAVLRGEEITIDDLRFLYPDDKVLDNIEGTVKLVLVVQEAKNMNLDVSQDVKERIETFGSYPPDDVNTESAKSIREFAESQAKKLGMNPEEYHRKYIELTSETSAYMVAYLQQMLGEPTEDAEEFNKKGNQLLDDLVKKYENEIEILIPLEG